MLERVMRATKPICTIASVKAGSARWPRPLHRGLREPHVVAGREDRPENRHQPDQDETSQNSGIDRPSKAIVINA
jgi:hypothetical protein